MKVLANNRRKKSQNDYKTRKKAEETHGEKDCRTRKKKKTEKNCSTKDLKKTKAKEKT